VKPAPIAPVRGRLFRARAVAEYLGITESKARTLIASGELIAVRTSKGRLEGVYEQDCDAWIETHRQPAPQAPRQMDGDERIKHLMPQERRF
jgi:excisionase family DNA binding protein